MKVTALDEAGHPVDWWFLYKVPKLAAGLNDEEGSTTGYEYAYFDQKIDAAGGAVEQSKYTLDSGNGALNETLKAVFTKPAATTGYVLYNDEMPEAVGTRDDGNLGHTKGVIAFDTATKTAYWLLHSWPKFADPGDQVDPTPMYGQTYLCLSLSLASAEQIAAQMLRFQEPQTYLCRKPAGLAANSPLLTLMQPAPKGEVAGTNVIDLKTAGGLDFSVIAKNREWDGDFWNGLVGPKLQQDIDVDSWIRGPIPPVADTDGIHKTFDIKYINLGPLGIHFAWPETQDHAKWAISVKGGWICVGDINRMISQRQRGGGTIAFKNNTLWIALTKTALLLAPPGHTRVQARALVHSTHGGAARTPVDEPATPKRGTKRATRG